MTRDSHCQYSYVHASTSLPKFACFWLRSSHARSSDQPARVCVIYSSDWPATFGMAPALANAAGSMPTQLCMQHLQTLWSAQPELSRSAASNCLRSNRRTRGSLCQYSYFHASTSLHEFPCSWLRSSHARSSDQSARVLRAVLVNLSCNVCTVPAVANATRSMPTQLCVQHLQTRRSAQPELSRSAASNCFCFNPQLLGKRILRGILCQYSYVHASTSLPRFAFFWIAECGLRIAGCGLRIADCGVRSAECGVRSAECGVRSAECGVRSAECGVRSADCGLRIADCGLRIADCGLRIADCGLRIADCGLRIADCGLRACACRMQRLLSECSTACAVFASAWTVSTAR